MKILSQRDPKWAPDKLGSSQLTLGKFGCTTTCISMLTDFFGCFQSPLQIAHNIHNYTKEGLIIWENLKFDKMKFDTRIRWAPGENVINNALRDLNQAIMLEVNNHSHWVLALRKTLIGKSWIVADPWSGDKCDVLKRYHNITGAAIFKRK